ncbi:DUF1080 domain-containing protein [Lentisphaera marina]|uniref:3-keto-disaccharide hydrolase n=1 Tax=Lentisphaera marina TaxID=1111041 RepID=UPI00236650F0|nr:DUF1080 domain-containing protein [Lentisphaera marina]MDD7984744.1 DUF1080 domain-containing protein [Lentisphaera marina]
MKLLILLLVPFCVLAETSDLSFKELFNGKDLSGWVNVNTAEDTWSVKDGLLICSGKPIGVMRSDKQYENFILEIEWRHMKAGGNSGVFIWSEGKGYKNKPLPKGVEVQMLELQWSKIHKRTDAYVSGELFGSMGLKTVPDNPRGTRSMGLEMRCKGVGEWNRYTVVAVDGVVKLAINGKFVNGLSHCEIKKGYLCLEAEGSEIHFRKIRIMELEPGITQEEQKAPKVN